MHASAAMSAVLEMVRRVAPTEATVLVTGESGTGKDLVARALHTASDRWEAPFVAVNCAAIPRDLLETELFGHIRGAFTGAVRERAGKFRQADRGTLFLDEIGDLAADLQTKLLRVLETHEVDVVGGSRPVPVNVRIVAATNADLAARVAEGRFRSDLYYRLNVIPIHIPPLRERPEDVPALWEHFVRLYAAAGASSVRSTPGLIRALAARPWPGNVRELANLCQRMVLLRGEDTLTEVDLAAATGEGAGRAAGPARDRGSPRRVRPSLPLRAFSRGAARGVSPALRGGARDHPARAGQTRRKQDACRRLPRHPPARAPLPAGEVRARLASYSRRGSRDLTFSSAAMTFTASESASPEVSGCMAAGSRDSRSGITSA